MRRVLIQRYRRPVTTVGVLVVLSLLASTVNLFVAAAQRDLHNIVQLAFANFEWQQDYLADFSEIIAVSIPTRAVMVFVFNALISISLVQLARKTFRSLTTDLDAR